jgi:hypothetical protein
MRPGDPVQLKWSNTVNRESRDDWLPERLTTADGEKRRVGVEIEFAGVDSGVIADLVQDLYGGEQNHITRFEIEVADTRFGTFRLELDSSYLKELAAREAAKQERPGQLGAITADLLARASELLVPWEIVAPPIAFGEAESLCELVGRLRERGALGTRQSLQFAFGVHLNPELPDLETDTIVDYLRAFFCLYDWIAARERIDLTRKLTPYIDHFGKPYIRKLIDRDYAPSQQQLIDDYLEHNPTRNRSLDMLPLFAFLDESRVRAVIDDDRINPRPTFHYRLPNCDIDNPQWNLDHPWNLWMAVEKLSNDKARLRKICAAYGEVLDSLIPPLGEKSWPKQCEALLDT